MSSDSDKIPVNPTICAKVCDGAPFGVAVVNNHRQLLYANAAAKRFAGDEQAIARHLTTPIQQAGPQLGRFLRALDRTLRDGLPREVELELPDRNEFSGCFNIQLTPLCSGPDGAQVVAVWLRDVSGYRQMSDRLIAAEKMASLGAMAGGVAHHFNTIVGGLTAAVDSALTSDDPAGARRALRMTSEAVASISKLTRSLMSFAEQDKRRMDLADLTEVVLTFVQLVERPLADSGICLNLELSRIPIVAVETNRMHQVLGNLLTNSEEAMPEGGEVTLTTGCDEQWAWLDFSDTGLGIKPEHVSMVFEPFFTTKGLMAGGKAGNPGLGLSVSHGLVLEMGGEIMVQPSGKGACLRIRFPLGQR